MKVRKLQLVVLAALLAALVVVALERQAIADWFRLLNYSPPAGVVSLANQDTMTAKARHLFYVNHPDITTGSSFTSHCPAGGEKTVVLGCYVGNDDGIYIYQVSDSRLNGVEQVTAAHETLHAAYRRLSTAERKYVDTLLVNYYQHGLTDQRIKDTIAAYQQSEPNDVVNEMHSVFGTEVANLPVPLEQYYKQYFTDRSIVTGFTAQYQGEFTSRQYQIKAYDTQLTDLKAQIDSDQSQLTERKSSLDSQSSQLQAERSSGQTDAYNSGVASYNASVDSYNMLLATTRDLINQYNSIVNARNGIALEEQQLTQELSAGNLPAKQ